MSIKKLVILITTLVLVQLCKAESSTRHPNSPPPSTISPVGPIDICPGGDVELSIPFDPTVDYCWYDDNLGMQWQGISTTGLPNGTQYYPSMAIGDDGTKYVSFRDQANSNKASVVAFDGTSWSYVGTGGISDQKALYTKLRMNSSGTLFIAYRDESSVANSRIRVLQFDGTDWIPAGGYVSAGAVSSFTMEFNNADQLHIAYSDGGLSGKIQCKRFNGTTWVNVGVDITSWSAVSVGLTFNNTDIPFISSKSNTTDMVSVFRKEGGIWIQDDFVAGHGAKVTTHPNGDIYLVYLDYGNDSKLSAQKYDGTTWSMVGAPGFSAGELGHHDFKISPAGIPYVVFRDFTNENKVTAMRYVGSAWSVIGTEGFSDGEASYNALDFDEEGNAVVVYTDAGNLFRIRVKYLDFICLSDNNTYTADTSGVYSVRETDATGTRWFSSNLVSVNLINANFSYPSDNFCNYDSPPNPVVTGNTGGIFLSTSGLELDPYSGAINLAASETGDYIVTYQEPLCATSATDTVTVNANPEIVSDHPLCQLPVELSVDPMPGATYSWQIPNTFAWGTLDPDFFTVAADHHELVLDDNDTPYLAYRNKTNGDVKILKHDGTTWVDLGFSGRISNAPNSLDLMELAISPTGQLHIAYIDVDNSSYTTVQKYNGSSWESLGAFNYNSERIEIDFDVNGNLFLGTVSGGNTFSLKKYDGVSWSQIGPSLSSFSTKFDIKIDLAGTPYLAHRSTSPYKVSVRKYNGSSWEFVGPPSFSNRTVSRVIMDISPSEELHVAILEYEDATTETRASVMKYNGATWGYVGSPSFTNKLNGIRKFGFGFDNNSIPYLAHNDGADANKGVLYYFNGTTWASLSSTHYSDGSSYGLDLAVNSDNEVLIAYDEGDQGFETRLRGYFRDILSTTNSLTVNTVETYQVQMTYNGCSFEEEIVVASTAPCSGTSSIPTVAGTYQSVQSVVEGAWTHYCDCDGELLLSLELGSSGAEIPDDGVYLKIGNPVASLYNSPIGFITNDNGGALLNRDWEVVPTIQPSSGNVGVRYYLTVSDYDAMVVAAAALAAPTTISGLHDIAMYKITGAYPLFPALATIDPSDVSLINQGSPRSTTTYVPSVRFDNSSTLSYLTEFEVSSFSGGGGGTGGNNEALPVELLAFTGRDKDMKVFLDWTTATEIDNKGFEIQHSVDGQNFIQVGWRAGQGNTTLIQEYDFLHEYPSLGTNYYRLLQRDHSGDFEYSNVISVKIENENGALIHVYPNPVGSELQVFSQEDFQGAIATIVNTNGSVVQSQLMESQFMEIPTSQLPAGIYFLVIENAQGLLTRQRFVKAEY